MHKNLRKVWTWLIAASMAVSVTACSGVPATGGAEFGAAPASSAAAAEASADTVAAAGSEASGAETGAAGSKEITLPAVGDELFGFRVTDITPFPQKNAQLVSLDHLKSGAEVLYFACGDTDKAVNVYYRTEAESDQGIPHVFEHITLSGSGKYPNSDLFDVISAKTYNTYMNAGTYQQMTGYNMASLSEDQLLTITMDELRTFYEKHYHPSNMLITLYGDLDLSRFLEKLDRDYLSRYDKKEITIEDRKYVPWTGERTETYIYPVTKDTSEENGSIVSFAVSLGDISAYDLELLDIVGSLLTAESSVLKQKMIEAFPSSVFSVNMRNDIRLPVMSFELRDAANGAAEKFHQILQDAADERGAFGNRASETPGSSGLGFCKLQRVRGSKCGRGI